MQFLRMVLVYGSIGKTVMHKKKKYIIFRIKTKHIRVAISATKSRHSREPYVCEII